MNQLIEYKRVIVIIFFLIFITNCANFKKKEKTEENEKAIDIEKKEKTEENVMAINDILDSEKILLVIDKTEKNFKIFNLIKNALITFLNQREWEENYIRKHNLKVALGFKDNLYFINNIRDLKSQFNYLNTPSSLSDQLRLSFHFFQDYSLSDYTHKKNKIIYFISSFSAYSSPWINYSQIDDRNRPKASLYFIVIGNDYPDYLTILSKKTGGYVLLAFSYVDILYNIRTILRDYDD